MLKFLCQALGIKSPCIPSNIYYFFILPSYPSSFKEIIERLPPTKVVTLAYSMEMASPRNYETYL